MRVFGTTLSLILTLGLIACGGAGEEAGMEEADTTAMEETAPAEEEGDMGEMTTPDWMTVDEDAQTITLDIDAGSSEANNRWNFNGLYAGNGSITVPQGYEVTINFTNSDPTQPHSLGIDERMDTWPATFDDITPVFDGALTADPATTGTPPNGEETITFTTDTAGDYSMVCYIAGHAVAGMVIPFNVSDDGSYGAVTP
ncbi:MAG: cupredoxin domain-containing protein [Gemmatimonadota bacterium]|nr:cupredoxin domain-containing protein [Gemmatimonadota bacterium]